MSTPRISVNAIEDVMSLPSTPIIGATAAIAELPQIEFSQPIKIARRAGCPNNLLIP
jgi:hypothetical protein